jgi:hypothetical protein
MQDWYYEAIKKNIAEHGRHCQAVMGDEDNQPFVYTIGNHDKGLPELLLIGSCDGSIGHILNNLSEQMIERGAAFSDGERVGFMPRFDGQVLMKAIRADPKVKDLYTVQAGQHYGHEDYGVMQVVAPDPTGKFPGEEGMTTGWADVPVYGLN